MSRTGQCSCGKVTFAFDGPVLLTAACHCRGCQRMSGSAFSLSTGTALSQFRLTRGEAVIGGLRGQTRHYFCDFCKSWLYTTLEAVGDFVNIRMPMLDDVPTAPPFVETYTAEGFPWAKTGAAHSFAGLPDMAEYGVLMAQFAACAAD